MAKIKKILTAEQVQEIDNSLRMLHDALPVLDGAQECGLDCEMMMRERQSLVDQLTKLKENFG